MKESELFEPLKQFLLEEMGCEQVYAELHDIDAVAKHGNACIGVEMKTALNFKVIEQAISRIGLVDYIFILVPQPKQYHRFFILDWLKELGVGLMYYDEKRNVTTIHQWGKRHRRSEYINILDRVNKEIHSINVGGSKGGETITEYKLTIEKIKECLYFNSKGLTIDELLEKVQTHYSNPKPSTMATLRADWNKEWIEIVDEGGKLVYRMKESYRNDYWKKYMERRAEIRARNRA
ncbi:hypothetical protein MHH70_01805 [Metasolibacillus sp. FSL H7-0170]|uniref:hypothetical protein n=1 Tax=Metasolibacillus sp. FSL H7-0170 TaxID=2921431 RepID=UPI0031588F51